VQLCSYGLNSETLTTREVTNWLECDKQDGDFEILNDDQITSNVIAVEGVDDDVKESELNQKPITSHSKAEAMLSKCIDWFEIQKRRQIQRRSYFCVKYETLPLKKLEPRKNRRR